MSFWPTLPPLPVDVTSTTSTTPSPLGKDMAETLFRAAEGATGNEAIYASVGVVAALAVLMVVLACKYPERFGEIIRCLFWGCVACWGGLWLHCAWPALKCLWSALAWLTCKAWGCFLSSCDDPPLPSHGVRKPASQSVDRPLPPTPVVANVTDHEGYLVPKPVGHVYEEVEGKSIYIPMGKPPTAPEKGDVYASRLQEVIVDVHQPPVGPVDPLAAMAEWPIYVPQFRSEEEAAGDQQWDPRDGYPWGSLEALAEELGDKCGEADCRGGGEGEPVDNAVPGEVNTPQEAQDGSGEEETEENEETEEEAEGEDGTPLNIGEPMGAVENLLPGAGPLALLAGLFSAANPNKSFD